MDLHYPQARKIVLVADKASYHTPAALYKTFPPEEALQLSVLERQCLGRRIPDPATLQRRAH